MAYFGSIGGWKESVNDEEAVHSFYDFRERRITILAEEFLQENGILPIWKCAPTIRTKHRRWRSVITSEIDPAAVNVLVFAKRPLL